MENTVTAITNGITGGAVFFDVLKDFIPFVLILIPIAVGWRIIKNIFTDLQTFGIGDSMSKEYRKGLKKGYWRNTDEYLNG